MASLFLIFLFYSVLGWLCETIYCSLLARRFVNRGFLNGPLCPVYGFGALLVIFLLRPLSNHVFLLFLAGTLLTSALEYFTAFWMEKVFQMKWWDYSDHRFHLHGRICLLNSIEFGILSVLTVRYLHPAVLRLLHLLPPVAIYIIAAILFCVVITDLLFSIHAVLSLNGKLARLHADIENLALHVEKKRDLLRLRHRRLFSAFPRMRSIRYEQTVQRLREKLDALRKRHF